MTSDKIKLFKDLSVEEKVDFFVKCQQLLINFHPESEFVCRQNDLQTKKTFFLDFIEQYKGYTYSDDNICVLFNKVYVENKYDPIKVLKDHLYQEPKDNYNAISIDFVVFKKLEDCLNFCKIQYSPQIQYLVFVKNNEVKIYDTTKLLEKIVNFSL